MANQQDSTLTSSVWYQIQKRAKQGKKKAQEQGYNLPDSMKKFYEEKGLTLPSYFSAKDAKDSSETSKGETGAPKVRYAKKGASKEMGDAGYSDAGSAAPSDTVDQQTEKTLAANESYNPYNDPQFEETLNRYAEAIAGGYQRQREESDKTYAANKAAADRQALSRGMQRSSYNNEILANIDTAGAKARQQISDQEQEAVNQYAIQLASELRNQNNQDRAFQYQKERDAVSDEQWNKQFGYQQQRDTKGDEQWEKSFGYQQQRDTVSDEQWEKTFGYQQESADRQLAVGYIQAIAQAGGNPTDDLLAAAGLSREDYNAMLRAGTTGGGGYRGFRNTTSESESTDPGTGGLPTDGGLEDQAAQDDGTTTKPKVTVPKAGTVHTGLLGTTQATDPSKLKGKKGTATGGSPKYSVK